MPPHVPGNIGFQICELCYLPFCLLDSVLAEISYSAVECRPYRRNIYPFGNCHQRYLLGQPVTSFTSPGNAPLHFFDICLYTHRPLFYHTETDITQTTNVMTFL